MADLSHDSVTEMASALLGLDLPDACLPGIAANIALLRQHTLILEAFVTASADAGEGQS